MPDLRTSGRDLVAVELEAAGVDRNTAEAHAEAMVTRARFARIESDLSVLKWMAGIHMTLLLVVLGKLFLTHP
jgi:hypothetical protein